MTRLDTHSHLCHPSAMSDLSLNLDEIFPPPPRGRKPLTATKVRDLTQADVASLHSLRDGDLDQNLRPILKIRDSHHKLARLLSEGCKNEEAASITGYDPAYISNLRSDPAFSNLIDYYRGQAEEIFRDMASRMAAAGMVAAEELLERLTTNADAFTNREIIEAIQTLADRTGFGPKTTQVNVNLDLAARLERARGRIAGALPPEAPASRLEANPRDLQPEPLKDTK